MLITITKINRFTKDKEGNALISQKTGRPYTRLMIKCSEYGDKPISGFENAVTRDWKEGDKVDVDIEEKGQYLNLKTKERPQALGFTIEDRDRLLRIEIAVQSILQAVKALALNEDKVAPMVKNKPVEDEGWEDIENSVADSIPF